MQDASLTEHQPMPANADASYWDRQRVIQAILKKAEDN